VARRRRSACSSGRWFRALSQEPSAALVPFYPPHAAPVLGVLAAGLTLANRRAGVAFALAVPVLPLGNVALGLAILYALVALAWLVLHTREPERAVYVALGPLLAPVSALALLPLLLRNGRSALTRGATAAAAVLLAAAVHGLPIAHGLPGSRHPLTAAAVLVRALPHSTLVFALALAAAAAALPEAERRGRWGLALWGAGLLCAALLPVPAAPLVVACWLTVGLLGARTYTGSAG
jgi:hypothetical protein